MPRSAAMSLLLATCLPVGLACVPSTHAEPVAEAAPVEVVAPVTEPEVEDEPEVAPEAEPEPEPEPEPEIADSAVVARSMVDPAVQPGLVAFAQELIEDGSLWVGTLEGNGGRDVLIYIPPGADDAAPFELVFHFHGTYSERFVKPRDGLEKKKWVGWNRLEQTLAAIVDLQGARPHNVALIYPFSAGKRLEPGHRGHSNVAYDRMWMDPAQPPDYRDDFATLHAEVVELLTTEFGVHPSKLPADVIAEGHSAGGIALLNIARTGAPMIREFIFLDASFQSWADGCYEAVKAAGAAAKLTLVVTQKGIADPFVGRTPWCADLESDAALWADKKSWCASRPSEKVRGSDWTCAELEAREQEWEDYRGWCEAMKDDMRSVPEVTLIKTKVTHGNQPRHFSGGLELPVDRF
jgi:pimeloyl-ACP methyl ester carboxylesterase